MFFLQRQEDVVALEQIEVTHKPLPPIGTLLRPKPRVGDVMYVMKLSYYGVWSRGKVLEILPKGSEVCATYQGQLTLLMTMESFLAIDELESPCVLFPHGVPGPP